MRLSYIEDLIDGDGEITLGYLNPDGCVAVASDESSTLAMLQRRPGESFTALLERLDSVIERAIKQNEYLDEINASCNPTPLQDRGDRTLKSVPFESDPSFLD